MSGNYIHIAPPEAYNQVYNYYQRVIGDGGTLIDGEAVNRIYHNLNLVNLENRSYKLYHASTGLQKTSDRIDKIYDLGKNDVDQTFSGSDRPEHVQAWSNSEGVGNWQVSVEKEATNYCKESNDLGSILGGNWTKTENKGDSPFGDNGEAVEVEMNTNSTGASNYIELDVDTAQNFSSGDYITISFYAKKITGSSGKPRLHVKDSNGNTLFNEEFETNTGEYQFFETTAQFSADGEISSTVQRIEDNDTSADTVYQIWGMQIELGGQLDVFQYSTSRIPTNGSTATRLAPDVEMQDFYPEEGTIVMWVEQVYSKGGGNRAYVFTKGSDYYIRLRDNPTSVFYQWQVEPGLYINNDNDLKNIFNLKDYETFNACIALSWSQSHQKKLVVDKNGTADFIEANYSLSLTGTRDVKLGQWDALGTRSNHKIHFDDIYISKETSSVDELKELVASLSKYEGGANLKTEDITIV